MGGPTCYETTWMIQRNLGDEISKYFIKFGYQINDLVESAIDTVLKKRRTPPGPPESKSVKELFEESRKIYDALISHLT